MDALPLLGTQISFDRPFEEQRFSNGGARSIGETLQLVGWDVRCRK
jgi:hypothetical protein